MKIAHPPWRWPLFVGWAAVLALLAFLLCLVPMTNTLGYELGLFLSLAASLGSGHLAAIYPSRIRDQDAAFPGARFAALVIFGRALAHGVALLPIPLAIVLLNGLRVPPCNQYQGALFFALLPLSSTVLAAAFGTLCGLLAPGRRTASILWFALWVGSLALALRSFYSTPAVFVFGPFFGYYPGVLYDTLVQVDARLVTYRLVGCVHCALLLAACTAFLDPASLRLRPGRIREKRKALLWLLVFAAASFGLHAAGPAIGHRIDRADLLEELPVHRKAGESLHLHFSERTPPETVERLARDAAFSLRQVETFFDFDAEGRIDVFLFDSYKQKGELMGASSTNVAKPWRSEVYVTVGQVPHRVLRHELAHAVAAGFASGPFGIAGAAGGVWPDPGLIEGLAVAAQGPRTDLTVHQWAAAMKRLELLPGLGSVFGLGFLDMAASTAYTAAGSFCSWVALEHGAGSLRSVYGGASWKDATGSDLPALEKRWLEFLDGIELDRADLAAARLRFDRPSVIRSVCVHEVARLRDEAASLSGYGRDDEAIDLLREAHEVSGTSTGTRRVLFDSLLGAGKDDEARSMAVKMLDEAGTGIAQKARIRESLADMDAAAGRLAKAGEAFRILALEASSRDARRRLEMKRHLTTLPEEEAAPVLAILARRAGPDAPGVPLAMLKIAELAAAHPDDPWLLYLLARQHFNQKDHRGALDLLERAGDDLPARTSPTISLAAWKIRGISLLELGRTREAADAFASISKSPLARAGDRAEARDWEKRSAFYGTFES